VEAEEEFFVELQMEYQVDQVEVEEVVILVIQQVEQVILLQQVHHKEIMEEVEEMLQQNMEQAEVEVRQR
jgi:hypothetical protein